MFKTNIGATPVLAHVLAVVGVLASAFLAGCGSAEMSGANTGVSEAQGPDTDSQRDSTLSDPDVDVGTIETEGSMKVIKLGACWDEAATGKVKSSCLISPVQPSFIAGFNEGYEDARDGAAFDVDPDAHSSVLAKKSSYYNGYIDGFERGTAQNWGTAVYCADDEAGNMICDLRGIDTGPEVAYAVPVLVGTVAVVVRWIISRVAAQGIVAVGESTAKNFKRAVKRQGEAVVGYVCAQVPCSL